MKLTRLFTYSIALLSVLMAALLGRILWDEWNQYSAARAGVQTLQLAQRAMTAAEKLSYERGPVNGVLGDGLPPDRAKQQRLARARADADLALAQLGTALAASRPPETAALAELQHTRDALTAARTAVDQLAALPPAQRAPARLTATVEQMFALIPRMTGTVTLFSRASEQRYPQLTRVLTQAYLAVELREYAGRIGSRLTTALSARQPLTSTEQEQIQVLRGRIAQLHQLLTRDANGLGADARVSAAVQQMDRLYFGEGLDMIAAVERNSRAHLPYELDTAQFALAYVPTMAPIVRVRDALLEAALAQARQGHDAARRQLLLAGLTGVLIMLMLTLLMLLVRRRVVLPLLWATRALVSLGNGELDIEIRDAGREDEIGGLLRALAQLRASSIEKQRLEAERQRLIEELRRSADTDYLTGILNRRAFTAAGTARASHARSQELALSVILLDIDHFKSINDRYGHDVGDQVLVQLAALLRQELRDGEILARYGGEEFIIMPACCDLRAAQQVAERLRSRIEASPLRMDDGRVVRVTASFGVAAANGLDSTLDHLFHRADEALYRAKGQGRNQVAA